VLAALGVGAFPLITAVAWGITHTSPSIDPSLVSSFRLGRGEPLPLSAALRSAVGIWRYGSSTYAEYKGASPERVIERKLAGRMRGNDRVEAEERGEGGDVGSAGL
jgi:hypothetical protein